MRKNETPKAPPDPLVRWIRLIEVKGRQSYIERLKEFSKVSRKGSTVSSSDGNSVHCIDEITVVRDGEWESILDPEFRIEHLYKCTVCHKPFLLSNLDGDDDGKGDYTVLKCRECHPAFMEM